MSSSRNKSKRKTSAVIDSESAPSSSDDDMIPQTRSARRDTLKRAIRQGTTRKQTGSSKRPVKTSAVVDTTPSSSSDDSPSSSDDFEPSSDDLQSSSSDLEEPTSSSDLELDSSSDESKSSSLSDKIKPSTSRGHLKSSSSSDDDVIPQPKSTARRDTSNLALKSNTATKPTSASKNKRPRKTSAVLFDSSSDDDVLPQPKSVGSRDTSNLTHKSNLATKSAVSFKRPRKASAVLTDSSSGDDATAPVPKPPGISNSISSNPKRHLQHKAVPAMVPMNSKTPGPTKRSITAAVPSGGGPPPPNKIAKISPNPNTHYILLTSQMNNAFPFVVKPLPVPSPVVATSMPPPPPPPKVSSTLSSMNYSAVTTPTADDDDTDPSTSKSSMYTPLVVANPKPQPVCSMSAKILHHISPDDFTDTFLQSGVFQSKSLLSTDSEFKLISEYITNSQAHAHFKIFLLAILKINRPSEEIIGNSLGSSSDPPKFTMMLWHGTKQQNVAAILEHGFRCPATGIGKMFGKGVYFADRVSKSAQYCNRLPNGIFQPLRQGDVGYLFLCEVVIGKSYNARMSNPSYTAVPTATRSNGSVMTFDSVMCTGENVPDRSTQKEVDGVTWPVGVTVKNTKFQNYTVLYNEYIVYDPEKIKIKYLVKVLFA